MEADIVGGERMRSADRLSGKSSELWPFPTAASEIKPIPFKQKNNTYNGQTRKLCLCSLNCLFWSCLHSQAEKRTFFMLQEGRSNKASSLFDLWSRRRRRLWCCPSLDWSPEAPVHVYMIYTALCQEEFIHVQLNLIFVSLSDETALRSAKQHWNSKKK